jgi:HPt (histidine-containing phosphotransfer) domain-containing protein
MMDRYGKRDERMQLAQRHAVATSGYGPQTRRIEIDPARTPLAPGEGAECGQRAIRLALLSCEPRQVGSVLARSGISSDTHDVRFAFLKDGEHEALAREWSSTFADGLTLPLAGGGATAHGRCAVVLIVSDRRSLKARIDTLACGDDAIAAEFMRILIDTNRDAMAALYDAAGRARWSEFGNVAHRLNGSLTLVRCSNVVRLAWRMEQAALHGDAAKVRAILPVFASVVQSLNAVMEQMLGNPCASKVHG